MFCLLEITAVSKEQGKQLYYANDKTYHSMVLRTEGGKKEGPFFSIFF